MNLQVRNIKRLLNSLVKNYHPHELINIKGCFVVDTVRGILKAKFKVQFKAPPLTFLLFESHA